MLKNDLDFTATPEYEAWFNAHRARLARHSVFSKGAAAWNAATATPEIHLTRDTSGMCRVFVKVGAEWVSVIEDNGDIINHTVSTSGVRRSIALYLAAGNPHTRICTVCGGALYVTNSGLVCRKGHEGARE